MRKNIGEVSKKHTYFGLFIGFVVVLLFGITRLGELSAPIVREIVTPTASIDNNQWTKYSNNFFSVEYPIGSTTLTETDLKVLYKGLPAERNKKTIRIQNGNGNPYRYVVTVSTISKNGNERLIDFFKSILSVEKEMSTDEYCPNPKESCSSRIGSAQGYSYTCTSVLPDNWTNYYVDLDQNNFLEITTSIRGDDKASQVEVDRILSTLVIKQNLDKLN